MNAYSELYLSDAMENMGEMIEYASVCCGIKMDDFFDRFRISGMAREWEAGNPAFISGMSGTELCRRVLTQTSDRQASFPPALTYYDTGSEFWCGWITAYLQWRLNVPFSEIFMVCSYDDLMRMYPAMHTASEERCAAYVMELMRQRRDSETNRLSFYRKKMEMTQKELSEQAEVNLRTLQQYEAGSKALSKASVSGVMRLAKVLLCRPEDLLP